VLTGKEVFVVNNMGTDERTIAMQEILRIIKEFQKKNETE